MATYYSTVGLFTEFASGFRPRERAQQIFEFPQVNNQEVKQWMRVCGVPDGPGGQVLKLAKVEVHNTGPTPVNSGTYTLMVKQGDDTQLLASDYNLELAGAAADAGTGNTTNIPISTTAADITMDSGTHIYVSCNAQGVFSAGDTLYVALQFEDVTAP